MIKYTIRKLRAMSSYDSLVSGASLIKNAFKFILKQKEKPQDEQAVNTVSDLSLSTQQLVVIKRRFTFFVWFFVLGFIGLLVYLYLLISHGDFFSAFLTLLVAMMFLAQAFKYHFWLTQIKYNRLGMTFKQWWKSLTQPH